MINYEQRLSIYNLAPINGLLVSHKVLPLHTMQASITIKHLYTAIFFTKVDKSDGKMISVHY